MKTIHVVGAAIFRDQKVLIARRSAAMKLPGLWEFPGGKLESGESPSQGLSREILEELGVKIEVTDFIARGEHQQPDVFVILDVYRATLSGGEPVAHEHDELRWVSPNNLSTFEFAEADIPAVQALQGAAIF